MDLVSSRTTLRRWSVASLVANLALVVTGGLVRVTGSGLGCSTWPQCEPGSYTPHPEAGGHSFIEFGNRLLTFVLVAVAIGTFISAWRARDQQGRPVRQLRWLAGVAAAGIPAQAIIGGISVLAQLQWWVVGLHLVPSVALIMVCTVLVHQAYEVPPAAASGLARYGTWAVLLLGWAVIVLGIVVTGTGPNAGDADVARSGFDLHAVARLHSVSVWLTVIATLATAWLVRHNQRLLRAAWIVLGVELAQGAVGYVQYFAGLPPLLVAVHMLGTALFSAAIANLWWLSRTGDQNNSGSIAAATKTIAR